MNGSLGKNSLMKNSLEGTTLQGLGCDCSPYQGSLGATDNIGLSLPWWLWAVGGLFAYAHIAHQGSVSKVIKKLVK